MNILKEISPSLKSLQRKRDCVAVEAFQDFKKRRKAWALVVFVAAKDAGKMFFTVKGNPRKLAAVVVQKARREADAAAGGHIGQGSVVIGTVEVVNSSAADQPVLNRPQRRRRATAHHQGPAKEVLLRDPVFRG